MAMEFTNTFSVKAPLPVVWNFLLDAQEVAPCVPGAQITETIDDRHHKGTVKIKLGAVQMTYRGELEMDPHEDERRIVLNVKGTEVRGSGGASGTVTNRLSEQEPGTTLVEIHSEVNVTGKVAQFGRGIMQDVANRMVREFAGCLEQRITERGAQAAASDAEAQTEEPVSAGVAAPTDAESSTPPVAESTTADPPGVQPTVDTVPPPRAAPSSVQQAPKAAEAVSVTDLLLDIARSRLVRWLRALADRIEAV